MKYINSTGFEWYKQNVEILILKILRDIHVQMLSIDCWYCKGVFNTNVGTFHVNLFIHPKSPCFIEWLALWAGNMKWVVF